MGLCDVDLALAILVLEIVYMGEGEWEGGRWAEHTSGNATNRLDADEDLRIQHLITSLFEECFQAHQAEQRTPAGVSERSVADGPVEARLDGIAECTTGFSFWKEVGNQRCCLTAIR